MIQYLCNHKYRQKQNRRKYNRRQQPHHWHDTRYGNGQATYHGYRRQLFWTYQSKWDNNKQKYLHFGSQTILQSLYTKPDIYSTTQRKKSRHNIYKYTVMYTYNIPRYMYYKISNCSDITMTSHKYYYHYSYQQSNGVMRTPTPNHSNR